MYGCSTFLPDVVVLDAIGAIAYDLISGLNVCQVVFFSDLNTGPNERKRTKKWVVRSLAKIRPPSIDLCAYLCTA